MKLNESPYERIKLGKKKIELRLYDEKRRKLNLGDIIIFSKLPNLIDSQQAKIIGLLRYNSFKELIEDFSLSYFGYPNNYDKDKFIEKMYEIYSPEKEKKYGVLGIKLELI